MFRYALLVGLGVVLFICLGACASDDSDARVEEILRIGEESKSVLADLDLLYVAPVAAAGLTLTHSCQFIDPGNLPPECREFVSTLVRVNPALIDAIARIDSIDRSLPPDAPPELRMRIADLASVWVLMSRSDQMIIDGWMRQNFATWGDGWDLRRDATRALLDWAEGAGPTEGPR